MKMHKRQNKKKLYQAGFTTLELMLAFALLFTITVMIIPSIGSYRVIFDRSQSGIQSQGNLRRAMDVLKRNLKEAKKGIDTTSPCNPNLPVNGVCIYTVSGPVLSFKVPETTTGGVTTYKVIKFSYDSNAQTLTRIEIPSTGLPATSTQIIGRSLSGVSFTQTTSNIVSITLSAGSRSMTTEVFLRNKS